MGVEDGSHLNELEISFELRSKIGFWKPKPFRSGVELIILVGLVWVQAQMESAVGIKIYESQSNYEIRCSHGSRAGQNGLLICVKEKFGIVFPHVMSSGAG